MIRPSQVYSPLQQREHILANIEPIPSALRPGSAPYQEAIDQMMDRLRASRDPDERRKLQEQVYDMSLAHKQAIEGHG